ncbi:MAG TPA: hypothetical protein VD886_16955, partial [Herpetosiphonaceae bacterium]|nr:hypothetical protein [Herpetosiphonaceae bacterium]
MTNRRKLILLGLLWLIAGCGRAPAAIQATPGASPAPESIAASPTPPTAAPAGANDPPPAPPAAPTATPADPPPLTEGPHWIAVMDYWEPEESSVRLVDIHTGRIAETHECYAIDMRMVDWSPDGRWLTCTLSFLHSIVTLADTTNLSTTLDLTPDGIRDTPLPVLDWSPDRSQVAISTGAAIAVFPLDGGAYRELVRCAPARCSSVAWSPDGRWLAYGHDDAVRIIDLNGGPGPETSLGIVERPPDTGSPEGAPPAIDPLVWSPDSARVAYVTAAGVFVLSVADGKALQL